MKAYASDAAACAGAPSVSDAIEPIETPDRPIEHSVLTFASAISSPVAHMYAHAPTSAAADGAKPAASVLAGSARTPAPIVVPATSAVAPRTEPEGSGNCVDGASDGASDGGDCVDAASDGASDGEVSGSATQLTPAILRTPRRCEVSAGAKWRPCIGRRVGEGW